MDFLSGLDFSTSSILASMFWGAIGLGVFVYGKRQHSLLALLGGATLMGLTYFVTSAVFMSLLSIGILVGMYYWSKR